MKELNRIDAGYCILNNSPNHCTFCECYKYPVPYSFLGENGVVMLCRGWVDYIRSHNDDLEGVEIITKSIANCIKDRHKELSFSGACLDNYGLFRPRNGEPWGIVLRVTNEPYKLFVGMTPSFYIKHIHRSITGYNWNEWYCLGIPYTLVMKLKRQMIELLAYNRRVLDGYTMIGARGRRPKKYDELFKEYLTKIKEYETA